MNFIHEGAKRQRPNTKAKLRGLANRLKAKKEAERKAAKRK